MEWPQTLPSCHIFISDHYFYCTTLHLSNSFPALWETLGFMHLPHSAFLEILRGGISRSLVHQRVLSRGGLSFVEIKNSWLWVWNKDIKFWAWHLHTPQIASCWALWHRGSALHMWDWSLRDLQKKNKSVFKFTMRSISPLPCLF